jgi:hypothetical protein
MKTALLVLALALPAHGGATNAWIIYDARGNYALGHSTGGVAMPSSVVVMPTATTQLAIEHHQTWARFRAFEGVR